MVSLKDITLCQSKSFLVKTSDVSARIRWPCLSPLALTALISRLSRKLCDRGRRRLRSAGAELFAGFFSIWPFSQDLVGLDLPVSGAQGLCCHSDLYCSAKPAKLPYSTVTCGCAVTAQCVTPPSNPALCSPGSPWIQERHELVHFPWLCTLVTLWLSAAFLIFHFLAHSWLLASPNEEPVVFSSSCLRDTAAFVSRGAGLSGLACFRN